MTKVAWYFRGNPCDPANSPILALTGEFMRRTERRTVCHTRWAPSLLRHISWSQAEIASLAGVSAQIEGRKESLPLGFRTDGARTPMSAGPRRLRGLT
jgi:hypothetical protein